MANSHSESAPLLMGYHIDSDVEDQSTHVPASPSSYLGRASTEEAQLRRGLNGRHTAIIAIAAGIGTGLFLGSGSALSVAGPLGLLIGYAIMGVINSGIAFISAETAAFLPVSGGFIRHIPMFTDRALGVTVGYMFWYLLCITSATEVVAASSLISFWRPDINPAIFITLFGVAVISLNFLPVHVYGEVEFFFGLLKCLMVIGLILAGLIVDLGGSPSGEFIGGRNWHGNPIKEYLVEGATGRFLAVWSTLINAAFAMGNIQIAAIGGSECVNPRVNLPKALRRTFWRILIFYLLSLLVVGLIVSADDERLGKGSSTASSPFVVAFTTAGIKALPSIINAIVITSAFSSGNGMIFLASRTLLGLASDGYASRIFLRTNRFGAPYWAVGVSCTFLPLAYLNCSGDTPTTVFNWFMSLVAIAGLNVYWVICVAYVRFFLGMRARGIDRNILFYKSWGQPWVAIACGILCFIIVLTSGFPVFFPGNWSTSTFLSNYMNCFLFVILYGGLKLTTDSPWIKYEDMDFSEIDAIKAEKAAIKGDFGPLKKRTPWWRVVLEKFLDQ